MHPNMHLLPLSYAIALRLWQCLKHRWTQGSRSCRQLPNPAHRDLWWRRFTAPFRHSDSHLNQENCLKSRETGGNNTKASSPAPSLPSRTRFKNAIKKCLVRHRVGVYSALPLALEPPGPGRKCLRLLPVCVWPGMTQGFAPWECCCASDRQDAGPWWWEELFITFEPGVARSV